MDGLIVRPEALLFINATSFHLTYAYNKEQDFSAHAVIGSISVSNTIYFEKAPYFFANFDCLPVTCSFLLR